jgi:hypothetical protein
LTPETDWGVLLAAAYKLPSGGASESAAMAASRKYEGETLMAVERERARKLEVKLVETRKKFIDGPVLVLPIDDQFGYGFDPNNTTSLDEQSTVYGWARITGQWGVLETGNGALMVRENGKITRVVVPAAKEWKLELKPGWTIVAAGREGDQTLKQQ